MNATGKRRLLKLADFLEKLPKLKGFDMGSFGTEISDGQPACGTSSCAAGWAASIPSFRRAGYHLRGGSKESWVTPAFKMSTGFDALCLFFDINEHESEVIFDSHDPVSGVAHPDDPKAAARRIREVVASSKP